MSALVTETRTPTHRDGAFGHARALSCRECGHEVDLGPFYACPECFGPLEVAYDFPAVTRADIEAGPANIWRYQALLPVPADITESPNTEPGYTRLLRADNLAREVGLERLWVKDDSTNPTNSFKDRVVACALSAARELGAKVFACPSTGNLANAVAAAGARAGIKTVVFIPSNLERPKQVNSAVYTENLVAVEGNYDDVNRLCLADRGRGGRLGVRQRQPPAVLRRGVEDDGLRDRRAARLAPARPDRRSRWPPARSLIGKIDKAFHELIALGLVEDQSYRDVRRAGHGLQPDLSTRTRAAPTRSARSEARHHRQEPRHRRPGRRRLRLDS